MEPGLGAKIVMAEREWIGPAGAEPAEDADSARLVARAQAGDHEAFNALYTRYFDRVYSYLRVVVRDRHEAEDLTQQTFVRVFEALPAYEDRGKPFRAWLFTVVRNFALMHLRKHNRSQVLDPEELDNHRDRPTDLDLDPDLDVLGWITDQDLVLFIERLPIPQLQALVLRYMLDMSNAEVAQVLDRTPGDIRLLQHRAIAFLKKRLVSLGRDPKTGERSRMRRVSREAGVLRLRRYALK